MAKATAKSCSTWPHATQRTGISSPPYQCGYRVRLWPNVNRRRIGKKIPPLFACQGEDQISTGRLMKRSPLQNRVHPDGSIVATAHRGLFYGNRGGKIHDTASSKLLPKRRWASRQWICCVLRFKDRKRPLMGTGYTELFFMDEVAALAAGHRPCFECRRADAVRFARAWRNDGSRETAPEMDRILHQQRLDGKTKRTFKADWHKLPVGAMLRNQHQIIAKSPTGPLLWSFNGYTRLASTPAAVLDQPLDCLTPRAILKTLSNGYTPHWHPSANC